MPFLLHYFCLPNPVSGKGFLIRILKSNQSIMQLRKHYEWLLAVGRNNEDFVLLSRFVNLADSTQ